MGKVKILFISAGGQTQDYLRDCVFHGLRTLLGNDVVDVNKLDSMYEGADRSSMYGAGMTLYSELPDIPVDRTDIPAKISHHYFDIIVWGSIHRCQDYLHEVASMYDGRQCAALDGEDHPGYIKGLGVRMFKRELHNPQPGVEPIHFAIPASKILKAAMPKVRIMAPCDPIDRSTYIYKDESSYYLQYAQSYYGATMKKAGFDCLRHYEILSQWGLPYFRCIDDLPATICTSLPREQLRLVENAIDYCRDNDGDDDLLIDLWEMLIGPCMKALREKMTTEALAKYVLDKIGVTKREMVCA